MKGTGILFLIQVHKTKVEGRYPLKGVEVERSLQAGNAGYELLLTVEAHANIVPHFGRVRIMNGCNSVLQERCIMVKFVLNDGAQRQNSSIVLLVIRKRISQELKCLIILPKSNIKQTYCCQQLRVLRICVQSFGVNFKCF